VTGVVMLSPTCHRNGAASPLLRSDYQSLEMISRSARDTFGPSAMRDRIFMRSERRTGPAESFMQLFGHPLHQPLFKRDNY